MIDTSTTNRIPNDARRLLEDKIYTIVSQWSLPGISVAVATPSVDWAIGSGLADLENGVAATPLTAYRLASISKPITATAVMRLVYDGCLDLDVPIQRYVPEFPSKLWPLTTRHLLGHLGGVRDCTEEEDRNLVHYERQDLTEFLGTFKEEPLLYEPGVQFCYSTLGYNLLGCIVESAAGMPFADYLQKAIFHPSQMKQSQVDDAHALITNRARGYIIGNDGMLRNADFADTSDRIPGAGLSSTVEDLVRFGLALQSGQIVPVDAMTQMWTRQKTRSGQETEFGLGWVVRDWCGVQEVAHGGNYYGVSGMLYMRPQDGCAIALLTNLQRISALTLHEAARELSEIVLRA